MLSHFIWLEPVYSKFSNISFFVTVGVSIYKLLVVNKSFQECCCSGNILIDFLFINHFIIVDIYLLTDLQDFTMSSHSTRTKSLKRKISCVNIFCLSFRHCYVAVYKLFGHLVLTFLSYFLSAIFMSVTFHPWHLGEFYKLVFLYRQIISSGNIFSCF